MALRRVLEDAEFCERDTLRRARRLAGGGARREAKYLGTLAGALRACLVTFYLEEEEKEASCSCCFPCSSSPAVRVWGHTRRRPRPGSASRGPQTAGEPSAPPAAL